MTEPSSGHTGPANMATLRARFPGYLISEDRRRDPPRYVAISRTLSAAGLYAIVTDDLGEMAAALAETERPA